MIGAFAAYLLVVSILLAAGGWASEQTFVARRWPRRFLWLATLCASVLFPLGMALGTVPAHTPVRTQPSAPLEYLSSAATQPVEALAPQPLQLRPTAPPAEAPAAPRVPAWGSPVRLSRDELIGILWLSSSIATALGYLLAGIRLARLAGCARRAVVQGVAVRMTPTVGPAVFGLLRPAILWPGWLEEAPAATQSAAIAHEQAHLAAGDPLMLAAGLSLVVLAPWNPALWWQLQRLRFAMEADCDRRVVDGGTDEETYALALLQIAQHRAAGGARPAMLMAAPSWLERRVESLLCSPGRSRMRLAALGVALALGAWVAVAQVPAPSLRDAELRKLPPEDTRPGADWARAVARSRYPALFGRHFDGTAVVAAIFNRDGTPRLVDEHLFAPGVPPSDLDLAIENQRAGVDMLTDVYYAGQERGEFTIGPWLDTVNTGRVFVVYEVLGREPDPSRSSARVEAALRASAPELFIPPDSGVVYRVTLFMRDDGTIARLSKPPLNSDFPDAVERFAALGVPRERLGRGGVLYTGGAVVEYAWPRRPDDPPDMWGLYGYVFPDVQPLLLPDPREDRDDEARIEERYFHDVELKGPAAITEVVDGLEIVRTPWILLGRDGRIWDAGLYSCQDQPAGRYSALPEELEDRYPGIRLQFAGRGLRIGGVDVATAWIAPDSPIQSKAQVDMQKRKQFLVTGVPVEADGPPIPPPMVAAVDLNVPAEMSYGRPRYASLEGLRYLPVPEKPVVRSWVEVTVTQADLESIKMNVRASHPGSRTQVVRIAARYGQAAVVELPGDTSDQTMRVLLRVERLKS